MVAHPLNRYQNYDLETDEDTYEYKKRCYEDEERYWNDLDREIERDYFDNEDYYNHDMSDRGEGWWQ